MTISIVKRLATLGFEVHASCCFLVFTLALGTAGQILAVTVQFGGQKTWVTNVSYQAEAGAQELVQWDGSDNWGNGSSLNGKLDDRTAGATLSAPTNGIVLTSRAIYSSHASRTNTVSGGNQLGINRAGADNSNCVFTAVDACSWTFSFNSDVWVERLTLKSFGDGADAAELVIGGMTNRIVPSLTRPTAYDTTSVAYVLGTPMEVPSGTNMQIMATGGEWGLGSIVVSQRKKGFCGRGGLAALNAVKPHWYYNWGVWAVSGAKSQFVPMMFSAVNITSNTVGAVTQQKLNGTTRHLLGFNEPDHSGQANMTVDEAIAAWPQMEAIGLKLISPAPAWQLTWLDSFMSQAATLGYRVDRVGYHRYLNLSGSSSNGSAAATSLLSYAKSFYTRYGKPVWITEIGDERAFDYPNTLNQNETFWYLWHLLPRLDSTPFVERYAVYSGPYFGNALFYSNEITSAGVVYKCFDQVPLILKNPGYTSLAAYKSNAEKLARGMELLLVPQLGLTNIVAAIADEWLWNASETDRLSPGGLAVAYFGGLALEASGYDRLKVVDALSRTASHPGEYQKKAMARLAAIAPEIVATIPTIIDFGGQLVNFTDPAYQTEIRAGELVTWNGDDNWGNDKAFNGTLKNQPAGAALSAPDNQVTLTSRAITSSSVDRTNTVAVGGSLGINFSGADAAVFEAADATTWTFDFNVDVRLKRMSFKALTFPKERVEVMANGSTVSIGVDDTTVATYDSGVAVYTFTNSPLVTAGSDILLSTSNGKWGLASVFVETVTTPYAAWIDAFALGRGIQGLYSADPDQDGACNLLEYATGGNPTNASYSSPELACIPPSTKAGGGFDFAYRRRRDAAARELVYSLEVSDSLRPGSWTNAAITEIGTHAVNADFEWVTNRLSATAAGSRFVRLKVTKN